jgi:asparaginyl-tRNA synthetase
MMRGERIADVLMRDAAVDDLTVCGWARSIRRSKSVAFIMLNDGSSFDSLQVVLGGELENLEEVVKAGTGASFRVVGNLVASQGGKQAFELAATAVEIVGLCDSSYPLQKKRHTNEYLRSIAHLRLRGNTFGAVFRVRNAAAYAIHRFFQERQFMWVHTPIITGSDCEGAGEMFKVSTLDFDELPRTEEDTVDFSKDFFGKVAGLTVSGQLEAEAFAQAFLDVYTFGPTFRAENSNTPRHVAEFWMVEPEMAFCDLDDDIRLATDFMKYVTGYVLDNCSRDVEFFNQWVEKGLASRLEQVVNVDFEVMTYTEAVDRLGKAGRSFEYPVSWGMDLQTEHERYITEELVGGPAYIIDYPAGIKPFYMYVNDDGKTVRGMDLLVPRVGEIIGGSQREHRLDALKIRCQALGIDEEEYWWYLDLRRFGTTPHAGFGLGFGRAVMYLTGMANIRDVIPFPRTPGSAEF